MNAIRVAVWACCLLYGLGAVTVSAREVRLAKRHASVNQPSAPQAPSVASPGGITIVQADVDEEQRYQAAKARAESEPAIQKLKLKANSATTLGEAHDTLAAYNRALFRKIGEIDPTVKEHADMVQSAILRMMAE